MWPVVAVLACVDVTWYRIRMDARDAIERTAQILHLHPNQNQRGD